MDASTAKNVTHWLQNLRHQYPARPVKVTLPAIGTSRTSIEASPLKGKTKDYFGAFYTVVEPYQATERAVTEGRVKAGEIHSNYRFYLVGKAPLYKGHNCFVWQHGHPLDSRVIESIGEWYLASYSDSRTPVTNSEFHPFGHSFLLCEWPVHTYGYYKGHKIDTLEQRPYKRLPMTVEFLDKDTTQ